MAEIQGYIPPTGFYFSVEILGIPNMDPIGFQEVKGLSYDIQTEEIIDGGDPAPYKVPTSIRYPNLVLKRGLIPQGSIMLYWCQGTVVSGYAFKVMAMNMTIKLLNRKGEEVAYWVVERAYPIKFEVSEFNAEQNTIVLETVELCYQRYYDGQVVDTFLPLPF